MGLAGERDRGTGYKVVESGELVDKLEAFTELVELIRSTKNDSAAVYEPSE